MNLFTRILNHRAVSSAMAVIALALFLTACNSSTSVQVSNPLPIVGKAVTGDTLRGTLNGTVLNTYPPGSPKAGQPHTTYYMDSSVYIATGDTLLIQPGITIIMLNTGTANVAGAPEFQVYGTFISAGTKDQPIYLTVPQNLRKYSSLTDVNSGALWGGVAGATTSGDIILKFTHLEFCGGSSGANDPIYTSKGTRYAVWFENPSSNFIMEDSWITGSTDDPLRVTSGKISIFRNVVESAASTSGDFNMKSGTVGDIAYNLYIGDATNGPKLANSGGINPQCNVNIYNNTIVTCGWRVTKPARAGSTNIEDGARGIEYNNLIVNCRTGFRLVASPLADTANVAYDYQWYYGSMDSMVNQFYPNNLGGIAVKKPHDVAGKVGENDPKFASYDVNQVPNSIYNIFPTPMTTQIPVQNIMRTTDEKGNQRFVDLSANFKSDFHLSASSPCIGKAYTGSVTTPSGNAVTVPMNVCPQKSAVNPYGAVTKGLGADFGAYQADGTGNIQ